MKSVLMTVWRATLLAPEIDLEDKALLVSQLSDEHLSELLDSFDMTRCNDERITWS